MRIFPATYLLSIVMLSSFFSCRNNKKEIAALEEISEAFDKSSQEFDNSVLLSMRELHEKLYDFQTKEVAEKWFPIAEKIEALSNRIITKVDSLQNNLSSSNFEKTSLEASRLYKSHTNLLIETDEEIGKVLLLKIITLSLLQKHY